jgi:hypothetical protein
VDLLEDWRRNDGLVIAQITCQERARLDFEARSCNRASRMTYPCRCKRSRSPCGSWCASSCHRRERQSSCQPPSSQWREPCQLEPCQRWWGSRENTCQTRCARVGSRIARKVANLELKYLGCNLGGHFDGFGFVVGEWWMSLK